MSQISTGCLNPNRIFIAVLVVPVVFLNSCPPACFLTISLSVKSGIEENWLIDVPGNCFWLI